MQLDGTLDKFPLRELIEMIVYSSVTGVLETHAGHDVGRIFFRDGRPYHAVAGEWRGVDAIGAMFEERSAPFRFVAPANDWYYLLAKCRMDPGHAGYSWYFTSSLDSAIIPDNEGE